MIEAAVIHVPKDVIMFELVMLPHLPLKESEDEGWWQGELNGRCGFFPDNFVMVIPPVSSLRVSGLHTKCRQF